MLLQAQVPDGVRPGEIFMAQTPTGQVAVTAPPGCYPGQQVNFTAPAAGAEPQPPAGQYGGQRQPHESFHVVPGQSYRVDPMNPRIERLPILQGMPVEKAERKLDEIRKGGALALENTAFPEQRKCADAFWIVLFVFAAGVVVGAAVMYGQRLRNEAKVTRTDDSWSNELGRNVKVVLGAFVAGALASSVAAIGLAALSATAAACVVWVSLLFGPVALIFFGLVYCALDYAIVGLPWLAVGVGMLMCVLCCYRRFIPFTILVVQTVSQVIVRNPMMVFASLVGTFLSFVWMVLVMVAFVGAGMHEYNKDQAGKKHPSQGEAYGIYFVLVFLMLWGWQVFGNICHVTYCGVFGRWYHRVDGTPLTKSLAVACTTSFGSICFGALLIAAVRAVELTVRAMRRAAQSDGNIACCIVLLVLECVVSCLGDILEYFSEWAYVQCAVRGVTFLEGARVTYAMMTCANAHYILSDLLINKVVGLGAVICALFGCLISVVTARCYTHDPNVSFASGFGGFSFGFSAGLAATGILSSGAKTILALWAENPEPLKRNHPEINQEFEQRIAAQFE